MAHSDKVPNSPKARGTAFVVMGFGKKTDFETGRVLDLDKTYKNMIKPAIEATGLICIRADEIIHSGLIDVPMYEQLLKADVVVADLSTSNKNALYELGVRHALRPYTTVIIAEDGIKTFPFDINHVAIQKYHHLGEDIGFEEVMRFRQLLTTAVVDILQQVPRAQDSPVYTYLNGLTPPCFSTQMQPTAGITPTSPAVDSPNGLTYNRLMEQVDQAKQQGNFAEGRRLLAACLDRMRAEAPEKTWDPYIIQQLALHTYKSKVPSEEAALREAKQTLVLLDPDTSNDTETLGLWGAVHKRLWEITKDRRHLDDAIRAYERGFYLRNDYYNGINFAYLLNVRATTHADRAEAIADFVQARRIRAEVLSICERWLVENPCLDEKAPATAAIIEYKKARYWVVATKAEAYVGLGQDTQGQQELDAAFGLAPETWMKQTTQEQLDKLRRMLEESPLKYVQL